MVFEWTLVFLVANFVVWFCYDEFYGNITEKWHKLLLWFVGGILLYVIFQLSQDISVNDEAQAWVLGVWFKCWIALIVTFLIRCPVKLINNR